MSSDDFFSGACWFAIVSVASLFAYGLWVDPVARVVLGSSVGGVFCFALVAYALRMRREKADAVDAAGAASYAARHALRHAEYEALHREIARERESRSKP